ncbi:MAG: elongation factor 4 [Planctomycetes bacterium]|nr:elongation factor 4 [Planctomycetota bacterium]
MNAWSIRNFSIIAHIDHGKSTLADRFLEVTGAVRKENLEEQMLDGMDLERERGITIKAKAVTLSYAAEDGRTYTLNLIDTPGHVDFAYEVSKALQACEGALLLVDAAQGIEAQTVANHHLAEKSRLVVIPVINKIDLPTARPQETEDEIESVLLLEKERCFRVSAKTGVGVREILEAVVREVPPPRGQPDAPLRALIFDAVFDEFRGVVVHLRLIDGRVRRGDKVRMKGVGSTYEVLEVGHFLPRRLEARDQLEQGEVGYMIGSIKTLSDVRVGDTVCLERAAAATAALPGYQPPRHMVFCGIYPTQNKDFDSLRRALERLALNDASFSFVPESSEALGFGYHCGFLGLLHMEIVQERLERESNVDIVQTAPNVTYEVLTAAGEVLRIESPSQLPDASLIAEFREPMVKLEIIAPAASVGALLKLALDRRGRFGHQEYISEARVLMTFVTPLAEIVFDFYDKLKSLTHGYGTMDYELIGFEPADLVRMRILVSGREVDALSVIVHREVAETRGRKMLQVLRKHIPRHMFEVALQAAIGGKIIARESIRALAKHVTAKCYGGDVTRKRKLLEKQKEGKKRMKMVGNVEIPQQAFLSVLGVLREPDA